MGRGTGSGGRRGGWDNGGLRAAADHDRPVDGDDRPARGGRRHRRQPGRGAGASMLMGFVGVTFLAVVCLHGDARLRPGHPLPELREVVDGPDLDHLVPRPLLPLHSCGIRAAAASSAAGRTPRPPSSTPSTIASAPRTPGRPRRASRTRTGLFEDPRQPPPQQAAAEPERPRPVDRPPGRHPAGVTGLVLGRPSAGPRIVGGSAVAIRCSPC